ncbi:hypothetical protein McanMca71_002381 [Microsporum canis]
MALRSSLGNFSKLPYEIRELIWLEFYPVSWDKSNIEPTSVQTSADIDLRVLRASRSLYDEISHIIYSKTTLCLNLSPLSCESDTFWGALRFKRRVRKNVFYDGGAVWRLESGYDDRDDHFDYFPFDKLAAIEISLSGPEDAAQVFWLWRNVVRTLELLETASSLPPIVIRLQKGKDFNIHDLYAEFDGYDPNNYYYCLFAQATFPKRKMLSWIDTCHGLRYYPFYIYNSPGQYIYDILIIPFYSKLRGATSIQVEVHSCEIKDKMDWTKIHFAESVLSRRIKGCDSLEYHRDERELFHQVFSDYTDIHDCLFHGHYGVKGGIIPFLHVEWDCQTFRSIGKRPAGIPPPNRYVLSACRKIKTTISANR